MEGVYLFVVSVIWICVASMSQKEHIREYICEISACNGQLNVEVNVDPQNCECLTWDGEHCDELVLDPFTCRDLDHTGGYGLCSDYHADKPCTCTIKELSCCISDTQLNRSILHFNCGNNPGASTNEHGTSTNESGASTNEPGASTNEHKASKNTETLVGGVVGGVIGGVIITAVVVLLWRVRRKRRRHQESSGEQMTDTHAYLGPGHTSDSQDKNKGANEKSSSVPDVVKTSVGSDTGVCAIISGDQGDDTEITDDITGAAGGCSVTTVSHRMNPQGGGKPQHAADKPDGEYNSLGDAIVTKADATHTYDRLGDTTEAGNSEVTNTDAPWLDYFVPEEPADTYTNFGVDGVATTTDTKNTYERLGNTDGDRDSEAYEILLKKSVDTYT